MSKNPTKVIIERNLDVSEEDVYAKVQYRINNAVTEDFVATVNVHIKLESNDQSNLDQLKDQAIERANEILSELASLPLKTITPSRN